MARKGKLKGTTEEEKQRPVRLRKYQYLYLIVCEDQETEKVYFERFQPKFPEKTVYITTIGTGLDSKGVVERAIRERKLLSVKAEKEVDAVWVVFDKDDADLNAARRQRFEDAFRLADMENI
jgi:hypothetical protein